MYKCMNIYLILVSTDLHGNRGYHAHLDRQFYTLNTLTLQAPPYILAPVPSISNYPSFKSGEAELVPTVSLQVWLPQHIMN